MQKYLALLFLFISTSAFTQTIPNLKINISVAENLDKIFIPKGRLIVLFSKTYSS